MGLFRKKPVLALTPSQVEQRRAYEYVAGLQPGTPEYKEARDNCKFWDERVAEEYALTHPKKDRIAKADWAKIIMAGGFGALTFLTENDKTYLAGKSAIRRFANTLVPRFWGKDMESEQIPRQPKR